MILCRFYLMSPKHCHAFVGYLEEEAVKTCVFRAPPLLSSLAAQDNLISSPEQFLAPPLMSSFHAQNFLNISPDPCQAF